MTDENICSSPVPECPSCKTEMKNILQDPYYLHWCPECGLLWSGDWWNDSNPLLQIPQNKKVGQGLCLCPFERHKLSPQNS